MTYRPSVLIVDDDEMARDMLARRLERQGFRASTAASGEDAICRVAESPVDLVMLDIEMPGLNGFEVLLEAAEAPFAGQPAGHHARPITTARR